MTRKILILKTLSGHLMVLLEKDGHEGLLYGWKMIKSYG